MAAVRVGILVPHPDDDVGPGVTARAHIVGDKEEARIDEHRRTAGRAGRENSQPRIRFTRTER